MKMKIFLTLIAICALLSGCTTIQSTQTDTTYLVTIVQASDNEYRLRIIETVDSESSVDSKFSNDKSEEINSLTYPEVTATIGGTPHKSEIKNPDDEVIASISLSIQERNDGIFADYSLRKINECGVVDGMHGNIKIK